MERCCANEGHWKWHTHSNHYNSTQGRTLPAQLETLNPSSLALDIRGPDIGNFNLLLGDPGRQWPLGAMQSSIVSLEEGALVGHLIVFACNHCTVTMALIF